MTSIGEDMVEGYIWKATDPHGPMPAYLAAMEEPEKTRSLDALQATVDRYGTQGTMDLAAGIAAHLRNDGSADAASWSPDAA